jgi:hypothetical protein
MEKGEMYNAMKVFLILLYILGDNILFAQEQVNIYFSNWNYLRRSSLSEEAIRSNPDIYICINDKAEIARLKEFLPLSDPLAEGKTGDEAIDIVIDFIYNEQLYETYIVNRFHFFKKGENLIYNTPIALLRKYTFYGETQVWH